jgi:hypothetical protein
MGVGGYSNPLVDLYYYYMKRKSFGNLEVLRYHFATASSAFGSPRLATNAGLCEDHAGSLPRVLPSARSRSSTATLRLALQFPTPRA